MKKDKQDWYCSECHRKLRVLGDVTKYVEPCPDCEEAETMYCMEEKLK